MEQIPGHARLRIIIHEFVYGFKWRSHSPGSILNMSNKRAFELIQIFRVNPAFIIFYRTAIIIRFFAILHRYFTKFLKILSAIPLLK